MRIVEAIRAEAERQRALRDAGKRVGLGDTRWSRGSGLALMLAGAGLVGLGLWVASRGWISIHFFAAGLVAFVLGALQLLTGLHLVIRPRKRDGDAETTPERTPPQR